MPTYCTACEHVHPESKKRLPIYWLCMRFPRLEGMGFVAPKIWVEMEPFNRCVNVNLGACPCYEPRREKEKPNAA